MSLTTPDFCENPGKRRFFRKKFYRKLHVCLFSLKSCVVEDWYIKLLWQYYSKSILHDELRIKRNLQKYSLNDMVLALSNAQKTESMATISTSTTSSFSDLQSISSKQDLPSVKVEPRQDKQRRKVSKKSLRKSDPYYR